jgi:WD40 repeat protein
VLWDLETGELIRRFKDPHTGAVFDSAMSPDGRTGLVGSSAQTIIQWQLAAPSLDELLDWVAANRYVRELTCEERDLYRIEPLCEE